MMTREGMHTGFPYAHTPAAVVSFARLGRRRPSVIGEFLLPIERIEMTRVHFAEGQILFTEGDPADSDRRLS